MQTSGAPDQLRPSSSVNKDDGSRKLGCARERRRRCASRAAVLASKIGGQSTDVVMLVMNDRGMEHLLKSKFTLGGDASVAVGPVGREATAKTDATMGAEILSWSRARGVFAGVSLQGATLRNGLARSDAQRPVPTARRKELI
jgi:lipid-binding SYLF domain-containing protein